MPLDSDILLGCVPCLAQGIKRGMVGGAGTGDSRTSPVRSNSSGFLSTLMHSQDPDLLDFLSSAVKPARRLGGFNRKHWGFNLHG